MVGGKATDVFVVNAVENVPCPDAGVDGGVIAKGADDGGDVVSHADFDTDSCAEVALEFAAKFGGFVVIHEDCMAVTCGGNEAAFCAGDECFFVEFAVEAEAKFVIDVVNR